MSDDRERLRLLDELARRATRRQFTRPLVLEAGAGTGKTAALVGRVLCWCLGPGWERSHALLASELGAEPSLEAVAARVLERVTAITFTERAAAEMADRIATTLARVRRGEAPIGWRIEELGLGELTREARASALLASLDRLVVGTIHGYCHRLLASYPLEAGLHPGFRVDADGSELRAAAEGLLAERMPALYGEPADEDALALAARSGIGPAEVARALASLAAARVPARELREDPFRPERVRAAATRLAARLTSVLDLLRPRLGRTTPGRLRVAHATWIALEGLERQLPAAAAIDALCAAVGGVELEAALSRLRQWARGALTLSERDLLGECERPLASASEELVRSLEHLRRLEPGTLRAATRLLAPLLEELDRRLRALGVESFEGLLDDTRALLRDHPEVRRRVQRSTDQLLVDEFQDTDPVQCEIVRALALEGEEPERPGLFLVGDPKQSIYGWRSADLEAYDGFVAELCARGGERHTLAVNFRSSQPILDEVERVVAPIMVEQRGLQPAFQRLLPSGIDSPELGGGRAPVEHWIPRARGDELRRHGPADRARRIEAAAVARDLVELHRQGLPWSGFAVLLRTTSPLEIYLQALRETGIPFVVERDRAYYRRREVIDAAALLRAVLDPSDQLALLTVLRSSCIGVPDAALVPLWQQSLPELCARLAGPSPEAEAELSAAVDEAAASLLPGIPGLERVEGWPLSLKAGLRALAELRGAFRVEAADRFLDRLRGGLLLEETEAARFLGPHRLANLDRFFRRVLALLERPDAGPQVLLRELRSGVAGAREEEEGALADESLDAVRVLTIHKAKGLTFDQVYLVGLHGRTLGSAAAPATEAVRASGHFELRLFGAPGLGFDEVEARRARVEQAELVRTFYVAMTRPRHRLVLAGSWPDAGARRRPLERIRSHMDLLQHRAGERPDLAGAGASQREPGGVRWVWFEERPEASLAAREARGPALTLAEARREIGLLQEARLSAAARSARPLIAAASAIGHRIEPPPSGEPDPPAILEAATPRARIALAVGSAIHRLLERLDLRASPATAIAAQQGSLEAELAALPEEVGRPAAVEVRALCARLAGSRLLARLHELADHVLARELPILLAGSPAAGPTGAVIGSVDLLYRDPSSGAAVVADYKTDRVDASALEARARVHLEQGRVYLRAVQQALPSAPPARLELWFLSADRIVVVGN